MSQKKRQQLIADIENAFKDSVPPPDVKIGVLGEAGQFKGKTWQKLSLKDVMDMHHILFFSPEGWRYFMPAYLIAILRDYEKLGGTPVVEHVLHFLADFDSIRPHKTAFRKLFLKKQVEVILAFLQNFEAMFPAAKDSAAKSLADEERAKRKADIARAIRYWSIWP